jgi:hypothetical protein
MKETNDGNLLFYIAIAVFIILAVLGLTYMMQNSNSFDERGTFGDMYGFANALFTGLSVVGLIVTILLQRKDLNVQKKELDKQATTLYIQNFESTFFQMLNLFNSIIASNELNFPGKITRGRKVFKNIREWNDGELKRYAESSQFIENLIQQGIELESNNNAFYLNQEDLVNIYNLTYVRYGDILGHYFRTYYHIIKLIDNTKKINKQQYISIARAQLSNSEQILLFFNCLHSNGYEKFKPLVEKYHLLHNIDASLLQSEKFIGFYSDSAYN